MLVPTAILMPKLSAEMLAGVVLAWRKNEGESVGAGEPLLEVETGEAHVILEAPAAGTVAQILAPQGMVAGVGEPLAVLAPAGESAGEAVARAESGAGARADAVLHKPRSAAPTPLSDTRHVVVETFGDSLRAEVDSGTFLGTLDADQIAGPTPVTAFLGALGGCLLMSLRIAARARKLEIGRTRVEARSNLTGHVSEIDVTLEVETDLDPERFARLVEVAERGCHIKALLRDDVVVKFTARRVAPRG